MIESALPLTANSKYLLSLVSRQISVLKSILRRTQHFQRSPIKIVCVHQDLYSDQILVEIRQFLVLAKWQEIR